MNKIREILIGTNNTGKYEEISKLLPKEIVKHSLKEFKILAPEEVGKSYKENAFIKASYFSKKTNLICLSDDSGLEIDLLNGAPGIYSSRWGGEKKNFDLAINKIFDEMNTIKEYWRNENKAKFVCCLALVWPNGQSYFGEGMVNGEVSTKKRGDKGFGYDPIFVPKGHSKTFGEMEPKFKMSIDHRYKAYLKIKEFFD